MAVTLITSATVYVRSAVTFTVGSAADVTFCGLYLAGPTEVPDLTDFVEGILVEPGQPLADGQNTDIVVRIGARVDADMPAPAPGDYQVWSRVTTADEDHIDAIDVVTVR